MLYVLLDGLNKRVSYLLQITINVVEDVFCLLLRVWLEANNCHPL